MLFTNTVRNQRVWNSRDRALLRHDGTPRLSFLAPAVVPASGLSGSVVAALPAASAQCPDVEVVFARGTGEPPGVGATGPAFIDNLRGRVGGSSVDAYPANYPATNEWNTGLDGIRDASAYVVNEASTAPNTRMVLSGDSQGAAVMRFVTSASVPDGIDPATLPKPLSPDIADHVAAVVLFGMPNVRAMNFLGEPRSSSAPPMRPRRSRYALPTIRCAPTG
jgi:cutinase